jgi:hypothetical protein
MSFIHNEVGATRSGFVHYIVARSLVLGVVIVPIFGHAGSATDAMSIVGP